MPKKKLIYPQLTPADIEVNKTFRGKTFKEVGFGGDNDRVITWIGPGRISVQYDSDTVAMGRHLPTVSMAAFLAWASHEVDGKTGEAKVDPLGEAPPPVSCGDCIHYSPKKVTQWQGYSPPARDTYEVYCKHPENPHPRIPIKITKPKRDEQPKPCESCPWCPGKETTS